MLRTGEHRWSAFVLLQIVRLVVTFDDARQGPFVLAANEKE